MEKNHAVSLAKGIGIFGVVAHHLANRRFSEIERPWIGFLGNICDWAVPLFIIVAGYLHGLSEAKRKRGFAQFVVSRANRLIVPYLLTSLVYAILYCSLIKFGVLSDATSKSPKWNSLWLSSIMLRGGVGEQLYFLPLLFFIAMISYSILFLCRNRAPVALFVTCVIFLGLFFLPRIESPIFSWSWQNLAAGVLVYLTGFVLSLDRNVVINSFIFTALIAAFLLGFQRLDYFHFCFALTLFSGLLLVPIRIRPLEWVGEAAGTIFLYHTPFFIQSLLVIVASRLNPSLHIFGAYIILFFTIIVFTMVYFGLKRTGFNKLAY